MAQAQHSAKHREAYPCIDAFEMVRSWPDRPFCEFTGRRGRLGDLLVEQVLDEELVLSWLIVRDSAYQRRCALKYVFADLPLHVQRVYLLCPSCGGRKAKLYLLRSSWSCPKCHGLGHRSRLMTKGQRKSERRVELERWIGKGRPKSMQQKTFDRLRQELAEIERDYPDHRLVVNVITGEVVTAEWMAHDEVHPEYRRDFVRKGDRYMRAISA